MKLKTTFLTALAAIQGGVMAAPVSITPATLNYSQTFDSLGTASPAWVNDSTIPGWHAQINNGTTATGNAQAADGITVLSGLLNCGSSGAADRALGSKATGTGNFANISYAVVFQNNGTKPITLKRLQYHAEYWRGNSVASTGEKYATFYGVSAAPLASIASGTSSATPAAGAGFTAMPAGANTTLSDPSTAGLDGNAIFNAVDFSTGGALPAVLPGQYFTLKWTDANEANTDGFQAIDEVQVEFEELDCALTTTVSNVTRNAGADLASPADDSINFDLTVVRDPVNSLATWAVTGPIGSATLGQIGTYGTAKHIANVPIAEFVPSLVITVADSVLAACTTTATISQPRAIGTINVPIAGAPIFSVLPMPTQWVYDDTARTMVMNNGGGGTRKVISSTVIDLTSIGALQFTADLIVDDTSSGTEAADSFVAYLILNGNTASPINLITPHDTIAVDGLLTDDELAPGAGNFIRNMSYIIPANVNSVQIVFEGINDSNNEKFTVRDVILSNAPPTIQAIPGAVVFNNHNTDSAVDDTFGAPITIDGINVGASPGWDSDYTPATGLYTDPQPVLFENIPAALSPYEINFADQGTAVTTMVTLTVPPRTLTVGTPTNIVRHENGPGAADDTVTFDVTIAGINGGPRWETGTAGVTPTAGALGTASLTIAAPLPASPASVELHDISYPTTTQTITVAIPPRYVLGQSDLGGGLVDLLSDVTMTPPAIWVNDPLLRTLTNNTGTNGTAVVIESEALDLSTAGTVHFAATFDANDSSVGSNFDLPDKLKVELIIDGTPVNLVTPYDLGNGISAVPYVAGSPVPNGAPDGWINGYTGAASAADGYADAVAEYNAHVIRDEFNRHLQLAADSVAAIFAFTYDIPASANSVKLRITSEGIQGSETGILKDILFTTGALPDTDGDGMTDAYETIYGLLPGDPGDKNLDLDQDGRTNYQEFLAGTAANNPTSHLDLPSVQLNGTQLTLTWNSVPGKVYRIMRSTDHTNWTDLGSDYPASAGTQTTSGPIDLSSLGNPARLFFYVKIK